jgi:hypothetical protein
MPEVNLILAIVNLVLGLLCLGARMNSLAIVNFFFFGFNMVYVFWTLIR